MIDASVAVAWFLKGQSTPYTESVLERVRSGARAAVPVIWRLELINAILFSERRGKISITESIEACTRAVDVPFETDWAGDLEQTVRLARRYQLSAYDAMKDGALEGAARALDIAIY